MQRKIASLKTKSKRQTHDPKYGLSEELLQQCYFGGSSSSSSGSASRGSGSSNGSSSDSGTANDDSEAAAINSLDDAALLRWLLTQVDKLVL